MSWDWSRPALSPQRRQITPAGATVLPSKNLNGGQASERANGAWSVNPDLLCFCFLVPNYNLPEWGSRRR